MVGLLFIRVEDIGWYDANLSPYESADGDILFVESSFLKVFDLNLDKSDFKSNNDIFLPVISYKYIIY